jgi:hypothetical protein
MKFSVLSWFCDPDRPTLELNQPTTAKDKVNGILHEKLNPLQQIDINPKYQN